MFLQSQTIPEPSGLEARGCNLEVGLDEGTLGERRNYGKIWSSKLLFLKILRGDGLVSVE